VKPSERAIRRERRATIAPRRLLPARILASTMLRAHHDSDQRADQTDHSLATTYTVTGWIVVVLAHRVS
jgi:hypothetical protein